MGHEIHAYPQRGQENETSLADTEINPTLSWDEFGKMLTLPLVGTIFAKNHTLNGDRYPYHENICASSHRVLHPLPSSSPILDKSIEHI